MKNEQTMEITITRAEHTHKKRKKTNMFQLSVELEASIPITWHYSLYKRMCEQVIENVSRTPQSSQRLPALKECH